jgi:hypothetical protein
MGSTISRTEISSSSITSKLLEAVWQRRPAHLEAADVDHMVMGV